jgi:hypothetical protein
MFVESVFYRVFTLSRDEGYNSVASAAYRSGERLIDAKTGKRYDYRSKSKALYTGIEMPVPSPFKSRQEFWNANEASHKRQKSNLSRDHVYRVPPELPEYEQVALSRRMARWKAREYGIAVDWALDLVHPKNPHVHCHTTTRLIDSEGFGKICDLFGNPHYSQVHVLRCRMKWAELCNEALARHGLRNRVDPRSLKARGINRESLLHEGPPISALRWRGIETAVSKENDERKERNALRRENEELEAEIFELQAQRKLALLAMVGIAVKSLSRAFSILKPAPKALHGEPVAALALSPAPSGLPAELPPDEPDSTPNDRGDGAPPRKPSAFALRPPSPFGRKPR